MGNAEPARRYYRSSLGKIDNRKIDIYAFDELAAAFSAVFVFQ